MNRLNVSNGWINRWVEAQPPSKVWKIAGLILAVGASAPAESLLVLAAASTTDAMKEAGELFTEQTGRSVRFSFASSGALARQIQSGASVDVFLSANIKWMASLSGSVEEPVTLLGNRLVMIVPKGKAGEEINRLAVGDTHSVPSGMYAKEALEHSGQFAALRPKMVMASNARAALMFVERGDVDAGIVYATDAKISMRVEVVSVFPEESHSPIRYPAAVCRSSKHPALAKEFLAFLQSDEAGDIFERYGFGR